MSIIDAFNTSEQIIDPSAVARPIEGFPDTVLVTFSQKVLEAAAKRFKLTLLKEMHCCYTCRYTPLNTRAGSLAYT